jgi:hypothetical protein
MHVRGSQKIVIPKIRRGVEKARYHNGIATMKGKEWYIRQGIWEVTENHKEDAFEGRRIAHHCIRSRTCYLPSRIRGGEDTCMS